MKKNKVILSSLISQVEKELENLNSLNTELKSLVGKKGIIYTRSRGSILHDFYNCCERAFRRIALEVNSEYGDSERWHKDLLYRMAIPIKGVRPRVISDELAADLDEYLAFRHLFRSIYGFELKGDRVDRLSEKFDSVSKIFAQEIRKFLRYLKKETGLVK